MKLAYKIFLLPTVIQITGRHKRICIKYRLKNRHVNLTCKAVGYLTKLTVKNTKNQIIFIADLVEELQGL